jgi:hypothetical protein
VSGTQAGELQSDPSRRENTAVYEAPGVLRLFWAAPQYMPEHLALWSHPGAEAGELEAAVIKHQTPELVAG